MDLDGGVRHTGIRVEDLGVNEMPGGEKLDKKKIGPRI